MKTSINFKHTVMAGLLGLVFAGSAVAGDAPKAMGADAISLKQAIELAKQHTGGEPMEAEREVTLGQALYEIELVGEQGKQFHTVISAATGDVVMSREKVEHDKEDLIEQAAFLAGVKSGQFKTLEAVLTSAEADNAGQVYEIELDDDHGVSYEIKLIKADGSKLKTHLAAQ